MKAPFVNFYEGKQIKETPSLTGVVDSEHCLATTVEQIYTMADKLSGRI